MFITMRRSTRLLLIVSPVLFFSLLLPYGFMLSFLYIFIVGIASLIKVLYLAFSFNDCQEAAQELKREIKEARADLGKKGLKFMTQ